MNCFYHPEKSAVAQCSNCGKGLCKSCIITQRPIRCNTCVKKIELSEKYATENKEKKKKKQMIISLVIFAICLISFFVGYIKGEFGDAPIITALAAFIMASILFAGVPYGWSTISRRNHSGGGGTIFIASAETWMAIDILKYMLKFIVSLTIGWIFLIKDIIQYCMHNKY